MNALSSGIVYDSQAVSRVLGLPCECNDAPPQADDGEVIIYSKWGLPPLRASTAGKKRMAQNQSWYDDMGLKANPGYYRVLLRVPYTRDNGWKGWGLQMEELKRIGNEWQPAPIAVATTALLVHLTETGIDLLQNDWCRCAEPSGQKERLALTVFKGRVEVCKLPDYACNGPLSDNGLGPYWWLAAAQKI